MCFSKEQVMEAYRENIGTPTKTLEREIDLAIENFTAAWVMAAIREAVLHNKLTWVYVKGILGNWERTGKEPKLPTTDR
jgi:DnaD/phage-associated family protein